MKQVLGVFAAVVVMITALGGAAGAQNANPLPLGMENLDDANYPDISIVVSVPLELVGKPLTSESFTVTESGEVRPSSATRVPTDGLQVVLLLDVSGSMRGEPIAAAEAAALDFLDAMPAGVEVSVVSFAEMPDVLSPFTTDVDQAAAAISNISLGEHTALYDGLVAGAGSFGAAEGDRRVLVLLSDGGDTDSSSTLDEAIVALVDADIGFFAVELQSPENDSAALNRLVAATGGEIAPAEDPEALALVFNDVASQIVNQYELRYTSETFGSTVVEVTAEADGVVAAARTQVRFPQPPPPAVTTTVAPTPETTVVVEALPPPLRSGSIIRVGWMQSSLGLWAGAIAVFAAIAAFLVLTGVGQPGRRQLVTADARQRIGESGGRMLSDISERMTLLAERTLNRDDDRSGPVTVLLEKAGIQLRPGELIVLSVSAALVVSVIAMALASPFVALVFGVLTLIVIRSWIGRRAAKRQDMFAEQLPDLLQLLSGSIRAGFGMMQAMDAVAREMPVPAGEEFQRVKTEVQLGRDVNDSLRAMSRRVGSEDFKWVVEAIQIHNEVGGDLADILDSVLGTVRDRIRVRRRIRTLSAEGRMSGIVLSLLPFVLVAALLVFSPGYLTVLVTTQIGRMLVVAGLVLMAIGALWIRRITTLKF